MVRIVFIALFLLFVSAPTLMMPFYANDSGAEKRALTERPAFSLRNMLDFFDEWQAYYADHFALRDKLTTGYIRFKMQLLHADPLPRKVRKGKDGWFYLGDNFRNVYHASLGAEKVDDAAIDRVVGAVIRMKRFCDSLGIGFYMIVPPNKHTIYPEYLPVKPNPHNRQKLDVLKLRLEQELPGLDMIDLRAGLLRQKDTVRVFYKTDSHWNDPGAAYGARRLLEQISRRYPVRVFAPEDYTVAENRTMQMDETYMLKTRQEEVYPCLRPVPGRVPAYRAVFAGEDPERTYNKNSPLKLVIFHDSFFAGMLPFFAPYVGDIRFVKGALMNEDVILEERPDMVILEVIERELLEVNM